jgi:hypothetical protein
VSDALFSGPSFRSIELAADGVARLQRFYEDNPGYFLAVDGRPPRPEEAREDFVF